MLLLSSDLYVVTKKKRDAQVLFYFFLYKIIKDRKKLQLKVLNIPCIPCSWWWS